LEVLIPSSSPEQSLFCILEYRINLRGYSGALGNKDYFMLKPQDIVVLLKVHALQEAQRPWTFGELGKSLGMSASELHTALKRAKESDLYFPESRQVWARGLMEFLHHGVRYAFPAKLGSRVRGIPTSHAASPLKERLLSGADDIYVWPSAEGEAEGLMVTPLHKGVPKAVASDSTLHKLLSLVDALRVGRARERELAVEELHSRLMTNFVEP
jgi:hypothetical protein